MRPQARLWLFALAASFGLWACPRQNDKEMVDPKVEADGIYLSATAAYLRGEFALAERLFGDVKRLNPSDPRLPAALGELYLTQGKLDQAIQHFEQAIALDPKRATNYSRLGFLLATRGRRLEAVAPLEKALELNPKDFGAAEELGELRLREGKQEEGFRLLRRAAADAPPQLKGPLYLHLSELMRARQQEDEALVVLREAWKAGVKAPPLLNELGELLVKRSALDEALAVYRDAAGVSKTDPSFWELVGELELKQGRAEEAEKAYRESLRVKDTAVVHVALARLCLLAKDSVCARVELDRAMDAATGEDERESLEIAELLVSVGRKKDGLVLLKNLAAEPDNASNVGLGLRVARLAKELGDRALVKEQCQRLHAVTDGGVGKCP